MKKNCSKQFLLLTYTTKYYSGLKSMASVCFLIGIYNAYTGNYGIYYFHINLIFLILCCDGKDFLFSMYNFLHIMIRHIINFFKNLAALHHFNLVSFESFNNKKGRHV